jgi:serine/threonine protein kinase
MSPELLTNQPYDKSSDVWALGVVAFELLALRRPFLAETRDELERRILASDYSLDDLSLTRRADDDPSLHVAEALVACGHPRSLAELATPQALLHPHREQRLSLEACCSRGSRRAAAHQTRRLPRYRQA